MPAPPTSDNLTITSGGQTWHVLQEHLDAYLSNRDRDGRPPTLSRFLPEEPPSLRRLVLIELIKIDLDYRLCRCGERRQIEDYWREFPELAAEPVPTDLIYEEFHIRRRQGEAVDPEEYYLRFPEQKGQLRALLGNAPTVSTIAQSASDLSSLQPGQNLDDFDLQARLGTGAFGTVFLARQRSMQRQVALKVSTTRAAEPETLAQLDHPCIVRVYDQKQLTSSGLYLMYMQYVAGGTLHGVIDRLKESAGERTGRLLLRTIDENLEARGESPPAESSLRNRLSAMSWPEVVCWIGARLAEALDHAHAQGVLHRDIKPANVLLTAEGLPRLADFNVGCASKVEGAGPAAFFGGSLAYMSPEHLEAFNPALSRPVESLDGRADLYSLGVLLWELLTGELPFDDLPVTGNWSQLLDRLLEQRRGIELNMPTRLPAMPDLPPGLESILVTCLSPDPNQRYQSGRELAAQLELCLKPRAREILNPTARDWRRLVRRFPIGSILLIALVVNGMMAVLNFVYNRDEIIRKGGVDEKVFLSTQAIINGVAFPLGIALFLRIAWPLHRGLKRLRAGQTLSSSQLRELRQLCLRLSKHGADICLTCWILAGLAYPIALFSSLGTGSIPVFIHFMASLAMCGLIAAAYPLFTSTFLALRAIYPILYRPGNTPDKEDAMNLRQVHRWLARYLIVAASVPLLALTVLSFIRDSSGGTSASGSSGLSDIQILNGILGLGGLLGFVGMFALSGVIRADLEALTEVVQPGK